MIQCTKTFVSAKTKLYESRFLFNAPSFNQNHRLITTTFTTYLNVGLLLQQDRHSGGLAVFYPINQNLAVASAGVAELQMLFVQNVIETPLPK